MKQFPQHLLAKILIKLFKMKKVATINTATVYSGKVNWGVSLGDYILISNRSTNNNVLIHHEWGHTKQSHKFGWLYLLVIGLPSITKNILTNIGILKGSKYYDRYPEKQADELGGIVRNEYGRVLKKEYMDNPIVKRI